MVSLLNGSQQPLPYLFYLGMHFLHIFFDRLGHTTQLPQHLSLDICQFLLGDLLILLWLLRLNR